MNSSLSLSRFGVISRIRIARSCVCVGRVHGDHVLVHRELVAVAIDDLAHVVALERHRERGERTDHRVARRERVDVAVDLVRLVVAGHRDHPVMGERLHRAGSRAGARSRDTGPRRATRP